MGDESRLLQDHPFSTAVVDLDERPHGRAPRVVAVSDEGLGNTSWVVDAGAGEALVVDPERDPAPYQQVADQLGGRISLVAETHLHADFVTGGSELAAYGAEVLAPAGGDLQRPHQPLHEGAWLDLGPWKLQALATPGHTPEHLAYLLTDEERRPLAVFTGGSLLVGSVARTDLIDPDDTEPLTRALWRSIHHELLALPDDVAVLPTHGAGSFCSAPGSSRRWTTIGDERRSNPLLAAPDEDSFLRQVLDSFGTYPPYFRRLREVNRLGPTVLGTLAELPKLGADDVAARRGQGAVVLDVRPTVDFAAGHIPGSLADTLRPQFASWLGWLVPDPTTPLVFVAGDHQSRREVVRQALNIGYENLAGELAGGVDAWRAAGGELATLPLVGPDDPAGHEERTVLDVRQTSERSAGYLPGATHLELGSLEKRLSDLPKGPVLVMCAHGERATTAASILATTGREDVAVFAGGPADWSAATGQRLVTP